MLILPVFVQNIQKVSSQVFHTRLTPPPPVDWKTCYNDAMQLSNKLLWQGYIKERLKSSLRKFKGQYEDLIKQY